MNDRELKNYFDSRSVVLFDSAMGTALISAGMDTGAVSEEANLKMPETVLDIHTQNINAGSDVITSNSFGVTNMYIQGERENALALLEESIKIAKKAIVGKKDKLVCLGLGPAGIILGPYGDHSYEEAEEAYAAQAEAGARAGADFILFETFADMEEIIRAGRVAGQASGLPVLGTMTFDERGYSFMGATPAKYITEAKAQEFFAAGANCTLGPDQMISIAEDILSAAGDLPVLVQPNAGQPVFKDGQTIYEVTQEEFASGAKKLISLGISAIGGCCGTTPAMISAVRDIINAGGTKDE